MSTTSGNCSAGYYCNGGSYMGAPILTSNATTESECGCPLMNYTGGKCWPGSYCPPGAAYPISCTEGMYCKDYGLEAPTGLCMEGYYCDGNASQPDPQHRYIKWNQE